MAGATRVKLLVTKEPQHVCGNLRCLPLVQHSHVSRLARSLAPVLRSRLRMQKTLEAVYEDRVLKPLEKLDLEEGTHFTVLLFEAVGEQHCLISSASSRVISG